MQSDEPAVFALHQDALHTTSVAYFRLKFAVRFLLAHRARAKGAFCGEGLLNFRPHGLGDWRSHYL
jgi:hypothetical protein